MTYPQALLFLYVPGVVLMGAVVFLAQGYYRARERGLPEWCDTLAFPLVLFWPLCLAALPVLWCLALFYTGLSRLGAYFGARAKERDLLAERIAEERERLLAEHALEVNEALKGDR